MPRGSLASRVDAETQSDRERYGSEEGGGVGGGGGSGGGGCFAGEVNA